jgi:hypothetical protein
MSMNKRIILLALPLALAFAGIVLATVELSDNDAEAVPADNGTSNNLSIGGRMQQYVGFYGNVSYEVRNNTDPGDVLYQKTVNYGKLYFVKAGATLTAPFTASPADADANGNFSLTGYYNTSNHFDTSATVCGIAATPKLNTTDNRMTGIFFDSIPDTPNYFFCTDVGSFASTNGFGRIGYEIIVAKTPTYIAYDIWYDFN